MSSKETLRKRYRQVRMDLTDRYRDSASHKIHRRLLALPEIRQAETVAVYLSKRPEADTLRLLPLLYRRKKTVAAPKVAGKNLKFFRLRKGLRDCQTGAFGIWEPGRSCREIPAKKIDAILVPGLVFDPKGFRLGYGKGFYDRFLGKVKTPVSIGLSYDKTLVSAIPASRRDIPVAIVVTDRRVLRPPKKVR
jgi:5-formyltetrahydrofolate cyclo-ligase